MNMPVSPHFHKPRAGDKFYDRDISTDDKEQPNGKIRWVDWSNKEVIVEFYGGHVKTYDVEDIMHAWESSSFGGCYMLYPKITREERLKLAGKP